MATDHRHDPHAPGSDGHGPINHETTDIHLDGVGKITIGFTLFMVLTVVAMYGTFRWFGSREAVGQRPVGAMVEQSQGEGEPALLNAPNQILGARVPAGPRLLTDEPRNLGEYRAAQRERLHGYGWVDRAGRVVHIPIERAIELTAARGLPVATPAEVAPADEAGTEPTAEPEAPAEAEPAPPASAGGHD